MTLAAVLSAWPLAPLGAAEEPADADESALDATEMQNEPGRDRALGGVKIVRFASSGAYALSIELAQALVDSNGGYSEWVVLASGDLWSDAVAAGPLAASLDAPVVLVPPGGLQVSAARSDPVEFLRSVGTRRVVIVGSPEVLPNHEPSVLFGLGMLPRNVERVWGDSPAAVSVAVAQRLGEPAEFGDLGRTVIIASDRSVADAVAVGPLAAAGPYPILLTAPSELHADVEGFLDAHDVDHVVIAGGLLSVGSAVEEAIEATGASVTRLAGSDRHRTAVLAMNLLAEAPGCADTEIDTIGLAPADRPELAMTVGPLLGQQCIPLLYTDADRLAPVTQNHLYLHRHRIGIEPAWHLIGDEVTIDPAAIQHPPVRMATVADNPDGDGQHIVVLDEHHQPTHYLLDAGFSGITDVQWSSDHTAITFTGIRGGTPLAWAILSEGGWALPKIVEDGTRATYELDLRSGTVQPRPRIPNWYASLIQDDWVDPKPSPDREYIVFRAPVDGHAGHSLFVLHVDAGEVRQLTHNATDDTHHIMSSGWLPDGRRFIYTHVTIAHFESGCDTIPQRQGSVIDVSDGRTRSLSLGEFLVNEPFLYSPDGRFLAIRSYADHEFAPEKEDLFNLRYWNCTYDGIGTPTISVNDISGAEVRSVTDPGLLGYDPMWSPDSQYLVFRAATEGVAGHSLFALDVGAAEIDQITHNVSDEHHHTAQQWLPNESRLLYAVQSIAELKSTCRGLSHSQWQPNGVPIREAHIIDLESRHTAQIAFEGYMIRELRGARFDFSPNSSYAAFASDVAYEFWDIHGRCQYYSEAPFKLNVIDVRAQEPRTVSTDDVHSPYYWSWSPSNRFIAYTGGEISSTGDLEYPLDEFILDLEKESIWQIDTMAIDGSIDLLDGIGWSPNGTRRLYLASVRRPSDSFEMPVVANAVTHQLLPLELKAGYPSYLRSEAFSPDGHQVVLGDWGQERQVEDSASDLAGLLYVSDAARDGALLGVYDLYAVTEPAGPVLINPPRSRHFGLNFRYEIAWTASGIFAAGEHYLYTSAYL